MRWTMICLNELVSWEVLLEQDADIIINLSRWFALSDAYPATIIARHLEFGIPVIGLNWAKFSFPQWRQLPNGFPPAGGSSTITVPPPVTDLKGLAEWFRTKSGGIDASVDFATILGEKEETVTVAIDITAVRIVIVTIPIAFNTTIAVVVVLPCVPVMPIVRNE